ncbi:hypothetical protein [Castellaniella sp.]|uniref:4'-phosphopantetheinyl transferase family protein n=1 Tax=Castellaniella sp. TaxID=1955812 RepID=UPI002D7EAA44|nr:hypothetical protein [Castellaniella sp.]HET8703603.1 hypothetical protein [Castellaniella sp.]
MLAPDTAPYQLVLSRGLPDEAGAARLRRDLPEAEWRWIGRLRRTDDRLRSLVGRALVRRLLGQRLGVPPDTVALRAGAYGKPALAGGEPAWHFNIAHSRDLVLVGVGPEPLGVDVEHCPGRVDADLWRLVTGRPLPGTPPDETAADAQAFCAEWVRREAALKACGLGLATGPGALRLQPAAAAGWEAVSGLAEAEGLRVRLLRDSQDFCAAFCLRETALPAPAAHRAGRREAPPGDAWSLWAPALADWIDD